MQMQSQVTRVLTYNKTRAITQLRFRHLYWFEKDNVRVDWFITHNFCHTLLISLGERHVIPFATKL